MSRTPRRARLQYLHPRPRPPRHVRVLTDVLWALAMLSVGFLLGWGLAHG